MNLLINIDVPDLHRARDFYCNAFGMQPGRRLGDGVLELLGGPTPVYLLQKAPGTKPFPAGEALRSYQRHWCPIHLDLVVDDIEAACRQAIAAGAIPEQPIVSASWGKLALFADPFGNGFCLIQFLGRGYDEIAAPPL